MTVGRRAPRSPRPPAPAAAPARAQAADAGPGTAGVRQLQRSIGNRAATRLLLRDTEAEVAADAERERARFDALRARRPASDEPPPHQLRRAGITTADKVGESTPMDIQRALAESRVLRPYLRGSFPGRAINRTRFEVTSREKDFNRAFARSIGVADTVTDEELVQRYGKVGGYYERAKDTIHVRARSTFGQALHEAMHKLAHPGFKWWGKLLDEGVTQLLADRVLVEQGLPKDTSHDYGKELGCAEKLVAATDLDLVARAYFLNDQALRTTLEKRFSLSTDALAHEANRGTLCDRL